MTEYIITEQINEKLIEYAGELINWNKGINLIGKSTESAIWEVHIKNSFELYPFLKKLTLNNIIDIGSGGGFPSIPLALLLPEKYFYLTEVDSKKLAFLEFIVKKLNLPNSIVVNINKGFLFDEENAVISRAFSKIDNIITWADSHLKNNRGFYLLKGRMETVDKELKRLKPSQYKITGLERGCIVEIHI